MKLATLCYVKHQGKTLMLHRNKKERDIHLGKWNGLGGKIHLGETPEECVVREVKEESGLAITKPSLRGILTFPAFKEEEDWYVYVFVAEQFSGSFIESDEGELKWIDDGEVAKLPLWEGDPIFLKWIDEGRFFSGKFVYQDGKLIEHDVIFHEPVIASPAFGGIAMTVSMQIDKRLLKGIELFNEEEFFECHEVIEGLWLATQDEYKDLYKGVIQAAVALHHLERGNISGARKLYGTSEKYLRKYVPQALGLNVEKLLRDMNICFEQNQNFIPKLEFKEITGE